MFTIFLQSSQIFFAILIFRASFVLFFTHEFSRTNSSNSTSLFVPYNLALNEVSLPIAESALCHPLLLTNQEVGLHLCAPSWPLGRLARPLHTRSGLQPTSRWGKGRQVRNAL